MYSKIINHTVLYNSGDCEVSKNIHQGTLDKENYLCRCRTWRKRRKDIYLKGRGGHISASYVYGSTCTPNLLQLPYPGTVLVCINFMFISTTKGYCLCVCHVLQVFG